MIRNYAHRGFAGKYPEDTMLAFEKAIREPGCDGITIDVQLSKDGEVVIIHDTTLDRTTTGKGTLRETSYAEVSKLFLKNAKGVTTPYRVPTLNEVLEWSRDKVILHIDQKEIPFTAMSELVHRMDLHNIVFSSQVPSNARYMVSVDPDVMIIAWMHSMEEFRKFEEAGVLGNIVAVWVCTDSIGKDQQELAAVLRANGIRVMVATAASRDRHRAAFSSHPDIIETDYPLDFIGWKNVRR